VLVYRPQETVEDVLAWLDALTVRLRSDSTDVSDTRDLVVAFGDFETALADAWWPVRDGWNPMTELLRSITGAVADGFVASLSGERTAVRAAHALAGRLLTKLRSSSLPAVVRRRNPEGFSTYGLFPEQYVEAADRLYRERRPARATIIGLRSIGASLSSVVEAALRWRGTRLRSATLRPRGHPFERVAEVEPSLCERLSPSEADVFVLVDEGPGMSGSSFACGAALLSGLGVDDHAIVFLPSWAPSGDSLVSERARALWRRHDHYADEFRPTWVRALGARHVVDVGAGAWRRITGADVPVMGQHERRKFLDRGDGEKMELCRFAGFDRYGAALRVRAEALAGAGFAPAVRGYADGFLITDFRKGRPLGTGPLPAAWIERLAEYIALRGRCCPSELAQDVNQTVEMVRVNTLESLGETHGRGLCAFERIARGVEPGRTVPDARMMPHEWLVTESGLLKTDGYDHGDDDFFPGPADTAWDLAGAATEFALDAQQRAHLQAAYEQASGDRIPPTRLAFNEVSYLSFRLGYAKTCAARLQGTRDGSRFALLGARYENQLGRILSQLAADGAS
jgi:hypothetical protein